MSYLGLICIGALFAFVFLGALVYHCQCLLQEHFHKFNRWHFGVVVGCAWFIWWMI